MSDRYDKNGRCVSTETEHGDRCRWPAAPLSDKCHKHGGLADMRQALDVEHADADTETDTAGAD